MENFEAIEPAIATRRPWNKGKLIGAKPPVRPKHVWSIRTRLQLEGRKLVERRHVIPYFAGRIG